MNANVRFQTFYFLSCKGVISRERANEGVSSVVRELLVSLLCLLEKQIALICQFSLSSSASSLLFRNIVDSERKIFYRPSNS